MHFVYLLKLSNQQYYVGQTSDVFRRLKYHQAGRVPSTAKFSTKELVWYAAFQDKQTASAFEKYLKSSAGKAFRNKHLL
ncbi:MAG: GIY-YIG nuclease family protein [Actinomycetota bacterium]